MLSKKIKECPQCPKIMDEIKSIDFSKTQSGKKGNGKTYFYCKRCKISVGIDK
jgi:hypothetical protein